MLKQTGYRISLVVFILLILFPWQLWLDASIDLTNADLVSSFKHPLGTDSLGRDQFLMLIEGLRFTLPSLWLSCFTGMFLGGFLALQRLKSHFLALQVVDILLLSLSSLPVLIVGFILMVFLQDQGLLSLFVTLSMFFLFRSYAFLLQLHSKSSSLEYWQAHTALGGGVIQRVIRYGILGSWRPEVASFVSQNLRVAIIVEVSISFLGFGIQEPWPSFGRLFAENLTRVFQGYWLMPLMLAFTVALSIALPKAILIAFNLDGKFFLRETNRFVRAV